MAFAQRLQEVRRRSGLTQEQFAERLCVSRQAVSKWESGRGYPEIEKILYICSCYGVTLNELFDQELPPPSESSAPEPEPAPLPTESLHRSLAAFFNNLAPRNKSLTSRDTINAKMRTILDEATDPWGIKVNRVELKNILPPREIQNAMEKQMKAERERRESILQAEGEKASKILVAEGEKQSTILRADAAKQAKIMAAEAEAQSILKVQQAMADSMRLLNENAPNDQVIKLKALEAFQKAADGKATKIIIPSEIQGLAGLAAGAQALLEKDPPAEE